MSVNLKILKEVLSQPTAPYRENHVVEYFCHYFEKEKIPYFGDRFGNLLVGCASEREYKRRVALKTKEPLRFFIAHMDHPGFHGVRWIGKGQKLLQVEWHGGSPRRHLAGAAVWLGDQHGWKMEGELTKPVLTKRKTSLKSGVIRVTSPPSEKINPKELFGGFRFRKSVWTKDQLIYTKAADDLVGAYAIAEVAKEFRRKGQNFIGLLSRAEEVGFQGAIAHFQLGWLSKAKRKVLCVSLETSRQLPGAQIGSGPVVRLGDRMTVFDANSIRMLTLVASEVLPKKYQRRIMDGGTCEATAATAYGFPSIGISVPLGNYHNEGYEGGPDCRGPRGPAPEFVHLDDVRGLIKLSKGLMKTGRNWESPWKDLRKRFDQRSIDAKRAFKVPLWNPLAH